MKRPSLTDALEEESSTDDQITEAIVDALKANDKVIEIRPAERSSGMALTRLLLIGAGVFGLAYLVRNSEKPDDLIENVKEKATTRIDEAEEAIEEGSETASERIEEGSGRVSEAVEDAGKKASDRTEEAGEKAADRTEEAGEKATPEADGGSSGI